MSSWPGKRQRTQVLPVCFGWQLYASEYPHIVSVHLFKKSDPCGIFFKVTTCNNKNVRHCSLAVVHRVLHSNVHVTFMVKETTVTKTEGGASGQVFEMCRVFALWIRPQGLSPVYTARFWAVPDERWPNVVITLLVALKQWSYVAQSQRLRHVLDNVS